MSDDEFIVTQLTGGLQYRPTTPLPYRDVARLWRTDARFRRAFSDTLRAVPYDAYFWETPPVRLDEFDRLFEFVVIESPTLAGVREDGRPFASHFEESAPAVTFDNLGRDARLVAPCRTPGSNHAHLAAFLRSAPQDACAALWQAVGLMLEESIDQRWRWLSTSGLGVHWLHVRLDSRPKYYQHAPYREE